jgi:hypothetical protein
MALIESHPKIQGANTQNLSGVAFAELALCTLHQMIMREGLQNLTAQSTNAPPDDFVYIGTERKYSCTKDNKPLRTHCFRQTYQGVPVYNVSSVTIATAPVAKDSPDHTVYKFNTHFLRFPIQNNGQIVTAQPTYEEKDLPDLLKKKGITIKPEATLNPVLCYEFDQALGLWKLNYITVLRQKGFVRNDYRIDAVTGEVSVTGRALEARYQQIK